MGIPVAHLKITRDRSYFVEIIMGGMSVAIRNIRDNERDKFGYKLSKFLHSMLMSRSCFGE